MTKPRRRPGRPSNGLTEVLVTVTMPRALLRAIDRAAKREKMSRARWLRAVATCCADDDWSWVAT